MTGYKNCECLSTNILFMVLCGLAHLDGAILQNELSNKNKSLQTGILLNQKSMNVWDTSRLATRQLGLMFLCDEWHPISFTQWEVAPLVFFVKF